MLNYIFKFITIVTFLISVSFTENCSAFECQEIQNIEKCTLCNYCTNVNHSLVSASPNPFYIQIKNLSPNSTPLFREILIPSLIFRPPIS